jgi:hypothetical protein
MVPTEAQLRFLIRYVTENAPTEDPLGRLETACVTASELDENADRLINHFVTEARVAGLSWTAIGARLGVTKQAVRKRFQPRDIPDEPAVQKANIYGAYTDPAKRAVALAQRAAQQHHHHYIGPEHLLLGLCEQRTGTAGKAVEAAGVDLEALRTAVVQRLLPPSGEVPERLPFTEKGKKVLELAARNAKRLGHDRIGTEHLLLGLIAEQTGIAADVLEEHGVTMAIAERFDTTGPEQ